MNPYDEYLLTESVNNVAPRLVGGGKKLRGPNALFDFMYQVWVEKALIQTRQLPMVFETERQKHIQQTKLLEEVGRKGKYTDSYGWSKSREFRIDYSMSRSLYHYFANIVGPFLGFDRSIWDDKKSRMWKRIKRMILEGDKVRISKFARDIERRLIKESGKRIMGVVPDGSKTQGSLKEKAPT